MYVDRGCGFGRDATLHLTNQGVRVVGTDGRSWDAPFRYTAELYRATGDPSIIWEGHKAGADVGYCQIEKLHNLESLPATGFTVACFPAKIRGASAGWTRAVGAEHAVERPRDHREQKPLASTTGLIWCGQACGRDDRSPRAPSPPSAAYRPNQACTDCRDTPNRRATSVTEAPSRTSRTAP